jgi:SAM-dependent methyltransferase
VVVNVGCGVLDANPLPTLFDAWQQVRVDIDPAVKPDIVADITDLSAIADGSADAVWAAHCIEHLYIHQVPFALREFKRILRSDGFVCVIVPDLQTVGGYFVADRIHEVLYESEAGPITAHDIAFGFGAAIANGRTSMAHRCGFTPSLLQKAFMEQTYAEILIRRHVQRLELMVVARITPARDDAERNALMNSLQL